MLSLGRIDSARLDQLGYAAYSRVPRGYGVTEEVVDERQQQVCVESFVSACLLCLRVTLAGT